MKLHHPEPANSRTNAVNANIAVRRERYDLCKIHFVRCSWKQLHKFVVREHEYYAGHIQHTECCQEMVTYDFGCTMLAVQRSIDRDNVPALRGVLKVQ